MNIEIRNCVSFNGIDTSFPAPAFLTRKDDPRPRCVLVIGDGMTQGLLHSAGLSGVVKTRVADQIPAPPEALYLPTEGDPIAQQPLWSEDLWPKLFAAARDLGTSADGLYTKLQKHVAEHEGHFNPSDNRDSNWGFRTDSLSYEVRSYLWQYFRYYDELFRDEIQKKQELDPETFPYRDWPWANLIPILCSEFRVDLVSYNYDVIFENIVHSFLRSNDLNPTRVRWIVEEFRPVETYPANTIFCVKPHGSLRHAIRVADMYTQYDPNPWLSSVRTENNITFPVVTEMNFDMATFPRIPNLVPPGFAGDDLCNPSSAAQRLSHEFASQADVVIFCGLSAAEPDTVEISELVSKIPKDKTVYQVGLEKYGDSANQLGRLLAERDDIQRRFVDAGDLHTISNELRAKFDFRWH